MCQAASLVVGENLAGKPFPQNHHTSGMKGEKIEAGFLKGLS